MEEILNSQLGGQPNALQVLQNALLMNNDLEPPSGEAAPHIPAVVQPRIEQKSGKRGKGRSFKGICQIPGCDNTLQRLRHWYKKNRVCQMHAEATCVVLEGQLKRFCQQCSRFEPLAEFDQDRRSCRKRLERHNARRRCRDEALPALPPVEGAANGRTKRLRTAPKQLWEDHTPSPGGNRSRSASPAARRAAAARAEAAVRPYVQLSGSPVPSPQHNGLLSVPQPSVAIGDIVSKLALDFALQQPENGGGGGGQARFGGGGGGGALQSTQRAQPQAIGGSGSAFAPVRAPPEMDAADGANLGMLAAAAAVAEEEQKLHIAAPAPAEMRLPLPPPPPPPSQHFYPPQQPQAAASAQLENMLWSLQQLSQAETARVLSSLMLPQMPALPAAPPTPRDFVQPRYMAPPPLPQQQQQWQLPTQGFNGFNAGGGGAAQNPGTDMARLVGLLSQLSQNPDLISALSGLQ